MIGSQVSHYRLDRKLGSGTYGEVYEGVHTHDDELRVAVKLVARALVDDARFVEALKKECRQLDRMDHPNVVRFRELVVNDVGVAMVLELLEGQDLHARLAGGPLPVDTAVSVIETLLEGLAYAHARGVMHRDIKPSNVYWCDDGRIKLLDFGIARAADGTAATKTGHMVGTLDYMAPERFDDRGGSIASDVYAVGLIAWELLAGRAACPDGEFGRKLGWHLTQGVGDAARVRSALPSCPVWFSEVIAVLSAKAPEERPADGAAALALLRAKRPTEIASEGARRAAPPPTVSGPMPVSGSVPPVVGSVPPVSVAPVSGSASPKSVAPGSGATVVGRSAPPGTVMGPVSGSVPRVSVAPTIVVDGSDGSRASGTVAGPTKVRRSIYESPLPRKSPSDDDSWISSEGAIEAAAPHAQHIRDKRAVHAAILSAAAAWMMNLEVSTVATRVGLFGPEQDYSWGECLLSFFGAELMCAAVDVQTYAVTTWVKKYSILVSVLGVCASVAWLLCVRNARGAMSQRAFTVNVFSLVIWFVFYAWLPNDLWGAIIDGILS